MVNAPVCGTGDRGFESHIPPHLINIYRLGCSQAVRHMTLTHACASSNLASPTNKSCRNVLNISTALFLSTILLVSKIKFTIKNSLIFEVNYCIVVFIGNELSSVCATTLHITQYSCEKARWCYGTIIITNNLLTILWFSRCYYHSYCLDYCVSSNFEQIIKAPHYAPPSYVVFIINIW